LRISKGHVSIKQILNAFLSIIEKHSVLRTSLNYDSDEQCLKQFIKPLSTDSLPYSFQTSYVSLKNDLQKIFFDEETNPNYFDLSQALVSRCHLIRFNNKNEDLLEDDDIILFNFHHAAFDGNSIELYLDDFQLAYTNNLYENRPFQYIDYAIHERQLDMSEAKEYWKEVLDGYDVDKQLQLCHTNAVYHNLDIKQFRSGRGASFQFQLDYDIVHHMLKYAYKEQVTMFQLGLTIYYLFIYKLTNGDLDLCIGSVNANRYRHELQNLIGMLVNTLPYRLKLDPTTSFHNVLLKVNQICLETLKHSHLPYQEILQLCRKLQRLHFSSESLVQTTFHFDSLSNKEDIHLNDSTLRLLEDTDFSANNKNVSKFDLTLSMKYDTFRRSVSCIFEYSTDLFDEKVIQIMFNQYEILLNQLFSTSSTFNLKNQPVYELSILLPQDIKLINEINQTDVGFGHRTKNIYGEIIEKVIEHPQKLAIILDEQSLTYAEVMHYVQQLSVVLVEKYDVMQDRVICLCVERSVEMVISILAILTCGACYCPLNSNDPELRLYSLIKSTQAYCILVHSRTYIQFQDLDDQNTPYVFDIEKCFVTNKFWSCNNENLNILSDLNVSIEHFSFLIFTSGSTGTPKAIPISQKNFLSYMDSYCSLKTLSKTDNIIQLAQSSYDIHIEEVVGSLVKGATLIMLHPNGNIDMNYLSQVIQKKQITFIETVPVCILTLCEFLEVSNKFDSIRFLRSICFGGIC
jgi:non-ribosomal peptide synthetase component F